MNSIGTGIYLAASILDHSCKPNAVATFEGPQISIRLIEDIPELDWSKIKISYVDLIDLPETRRADLQNAYYFLCECERCTDPKMTPKMLAMACPNDKKDCEEAILEGDEKCKSCRIEITPEHRENFRDVTDMTTHLLQEMAETRCEFNYFRNGASF